MSASLAMRAAPPPAGPGVAAAAAVAGLGPLLPLAAMALGLAAPSASEAVVGGMAEYVVVAGFCGVLALPPGRVGRHGTTTGFALALGVLTPALAWLLAVLSHAGAERAAWVALAAAAPVGVGAIGLAAAMGSACPRFAGLVLVSLAGAVAVLPATAIALGVQGLAGGESALRLLLLGVVPVLSALLVRRVLLPSAEARAALALVACGALALQALSRVHGAAEPLVSTPATALLLLALACLPSLAGTLAAVVLARIWPRAGIGMAEAALAGGYRNVTVTWVIVAPVLPPEGHLFMALTALPVFASPALVARLARRGP